MKIYGIRYSAAARRGAAIALCGAFLSACAITPWNYEKQTAADGTRISVRIRDAGESGRMVEVRMPNGNWIPCGAGDCITMYAAAAPNHQFRESNSDED